MAANKDIPRIKNPPSGDGHHITWRLMMATELAEQKALETAYDAMLARQQAFEDGLQATPKKDDPVRVGCVFAKSCKLPDAIINYSNPSGMVPTDSLKDYGDLILLGAREADESGRLPLKKISATAMPVGMGSLTLGGSATAAAPAASITTIAAATLVGLVALLIPSNLGDSSLYTEEQLRALKQARTRVRLNIEQQPDGSLKGYGFYTGKNRDWEMVDVVHFSLRGSQQIADLGNGVELIWTPAVDGSDILGIPALEAAPQAPHIWVYPPTEMADGIIVNPVYPPEYKDFILVFPANSGVAPVYIVVSVRRKGTAEAGHTYHPAPETGDITAFLGLKRVKKKTPYKGGLRDRWMDAKGRTIYEWDFLHGELEAYRSSDGSHLGSFDHITGQQLDSPKKNRSIKKYL